MQALCNFVKSNQDFQEKLYCKEVGNKNAAKQRFWETAAEAIKLKSGNDRHWRQVRKKWADLSYCAKTSIRKGMIGTY